MTYITGKLKTKIYEGDRGYKIGLFKILTTDDEDLKDKINKTITFTGHFLDLNTNDTYKLYGNYIYKEKYGYEYACYNYEVLEPTGKEAVIEFLSSELIKGCGEKTAISIVEKLGDDALTKIKTDKNILLTVPGITEKKAARIYESILLYSNTDEVIVELKELGFTLKESLTILDKYGINCLDYIKENIYNLKEIIDFEKLDNIFLSRIGENTANARVEACFIETFKELGFKEGSIYFESDEIINYVIRKYQIHLESDEYYQIFTELERKELITKENNNYYLTEVFNTEEEIADKLLRVQAQGKIKTSSLKELIDIMEQERNVVYNSEQKKAVEESLKNRVTIITGGPGTGKTTIINAVVKSYIKENDLAPKDISETITLLAPTGRASKKMSESTGIGAMTIHRYLKWNKETNEFQINEFNKNNHKLIIVDEVSMIDMNLFSALLKGINTNIQLILVGDIYQLPSVGAGNILNDLIESKIFTYCPLSKIYRQSDNSYIPVLADEIKNNNILNFLEKKDDYNFLSSDSINIKNLIKQIIEMTKQKGIDENNLQVLAPIYRGMNGIDNLNALLQSIYNQGDSKKKEITLGDIIYREGDKVLQLVNNPDANIYNGDIGFIERIAPHYTNAKKIVITIDFDGNKVEYFKEDLYNIKHAYAITIHKAQGSEFDNVVLPISKEYRSMLYNKLLYTGVSRAKKNLIIIGDETSFLEAASNNYSQQRKTTLKEKLMNNKI